MRTAGFVGLGVMGEPMCRHLAQKKDSVDIATVLACDLSPLPISRLAAYGVGAVASVAELFARADIVFLSLPGGAEVEAVIADSQLLNKAQSKSVCNTLVDLSTTPVELTREIAAKLTDEGIEYIDAPVARTRQAAEDGKLAISVGCREKVFEKIEPLLRCFASDISYCGDHGSGQIVKILNNMVLFQTVVGLAEALAVGRAAGMDGEVLFAALSKGSADSFALRNHGLKALLPGEFPEQAFSTRYASKDLDYALQLAEQTGLTLDGAAVAREIFEQTIEMGCGDKYWPVLMKRFDRKISPTA